MNPTNIPTAQDRMKAAAFGFTTVLTSPLYKLAQDTVTKASTLFVQRMKEAHARQENIKALILEHVKA